MRALLVAANVNELFLDDLKDDQTLLASASREQFLTEIVAIVVHHEVTESLLDLAQEELDNLPLTLGDLLLQEPASSLL